MTTPEQTPPETQHDSTAVAEVDPNEAAALASAGALLLDVREPNEWTDGHIAGARHMPLGDLDPATITDEAAGRPIVAVCRSGNRSGKAAATLAQHGQYVVNMGGGMKAWQAAGLPVVTDTGEPGTV